MIPDVIIVHDHDRIDSQIRWILERSPLTCVLVATSNFTDARGGRVLGMGAMAYFENADKKLTRDLKKAAFNMVWKERLH